MNLQEKEGITILKEVRQLVEKTSLVKTSIIPRNILQEQAHELAWSIQSLLMTFTQSMANGQLPFQELTLKSGDCCPNCGSMSIEGDLIEDNYGPIRCDQEVYCRTCNTVWDEIYKMEKIVLKAKD